MTYYVEFAGIIFANFYQFLMGRLHRVQAEYVNDFMGSKTKSLSLCNTYVNTKVCTSCDRPGVNVPELSKANP